MTQLSLAKQNLIGGEGAVRRFAIRTLDSLSLALVHSEE